MVNISKFLSLLGILSIIAGTTFILMLASGYAQINFKANKTLQQEASSTSDQFLMSRAMADELNKEYESTDREFAACLAANQVIDKTESLMKISYLLTGFDTDIHFFSQGFSTMGYCQSGVIHSHPKETCHFSIADIYSFKERIKKGEYFSVMMCGVDKFLYITRNDFSERPVQIEA